MGRSAETPLTRPAAARLNPGKAPSVHCAGERRETGTLQLLAAGTRFDSLKTFPDPDSPLGGPHRAGRSAGRLAVRDV